MLELKDMQAGAGPGDVASLGTELARLQSAIAAARRRLDLTLDSAGAVCTWDWDIAVGKLTADPYFAAITGQDPVELAEGAPTRRFFHNIHPEDDKRIRLAVAAILAGAELFSKEYRLLREDGGIRWVRARGQAIFDADDRPVKFTGMLVDITDKKRAQEQLRIAQVAGGIGTFDYVTGFATLNVSEQFCRLFGLHPTKSLPVATLNMLIHADDRPFIQIGAPDAGEAEAEREFRVTRADDGTERWLARRGEYVQDLGSGGTRYLGVIYDVTSDKQTQARLHAANNALAKRVEDRTRERDRIWQNSRDLLVVVGEDGICRDINPAWHEVLGYEPHEVIGRHALDFVWTDDVDKGREALQRAVDQIHDGLVLRQTQKNGEPRWISWRTSFENGLIYAYGRDITLEMRQADVLRETEAQLRQSQKMEAVGQLTGGIAHDFNNMLTGVIGALSVVKRRIASGRLDDLDRFIDAATSSAHRAAALTHRLLAFSRRQSLDRQLIDINALVASIEDLLRRTLGEHIELAINLSGDAWHALTDANQLESAILNLVINARDAMPLGGRLTIATANVDLTASDIRDSEDLTAGSYVSLSVGDTGIGMSKSTLEKAFEPFFTTKPIGQGTGLGLSMIYGFVKQSGGHVQIESELGHGTTIKLLLPSASTIPPRAAIEARAAAEAPMGDGEIVLVIEDDDAVRMLVIAVLKDLGYHALEAIDGAHALPIIESDQRIDLIISDVGLPGMNGRQLAEIAVGIRPDLRVLFITGYTAQAESRAEFLGPGMDMIKKPFAIDDLALKVKEILGSAFG
jgi:PAS domain S-box-containing protein